MALKLFSRTKAATGTLKPQKESEGGNGQVPVPSSPSAYQPAPREALPSDPARRLLQQGRYNLILREADKWRYVIDGGESYAAASERATRWLAGCTAPLTVAVTHEMMSRSIQGAYAGLSPEDTLARSHPQDRIYRLHGGAIAELVIVRR